MKRDMELVRAMLMAVEDADGVVSIETFVDGAHTMEVVAYHAELMEAHGLVDAEVLHANNRAYQGIIVGLTWDGADFLDAVRDDNIWKKTKAAIKKATTSVTLDTFKEVAKLVAVQSIKSGIGVQ